MTGEHRRYSRGTVHIRGPIPERLFGPVELGARVSHLDLIDEDIAGGRATDVTGGLDWYLRQNLRLMFDYFHVAALLRQTLQHEGFHIVQGRPAVFFWTRPAWENSHGETQGALSAYLRRSTTSLAASARVEWPRTGRGRVRARPSRAAGARFGTRR